MNRDSETNEREIVIQKKEKGKGVKKLTNLVVLAPLDDLLEDGSSDVL